jgi:hypothetical protein
VPKNVESVSLLLPLFVQEFMDINYVMKCFALRLHAHCSIATYKWLAVTFVSFEVNTVLNITKNNVS